jgi:hydrogenase expression/formation protein HypE
MTADSDSKRILLAHGGGGQLSENLIRETVLPRIGTRAAAPMNDAACIELGSERVFMTTDSFVVKPLFFPGGDIGKLAVCGTVNDLAVAGARPQALSLALIIEEGFPQTELERILDSIGQAAQANHVQIVTGDTKTVESGSADGIFINTTGVGGRHPLAHLGFDRIKSGDRVLVSGTLGDHGMTIMSLREDLQFQSQLQSDCAGLADLIDTLFVAGCDIKFLRDPTRGGLAASLNEVARTTSWNVTIEQNAIPVRPEVQAAADMLGFDVLNIANEGKFVAIVAEADADRCLEICHHHELGQQARIIGEIGPQDDAPMVVMKTKIGGRRVVQMPYGRDLPRIC